MLSKLILSTQTQSLPLLGNVGNDRISCPVGVSFHCKAGADDVFQPGGCQLRYFSASTEGRHHPEDGINTAGHNIEGNGNDFSEYHSRVAPAKGSLSMSTTRALANAQAITTTLYLPKSRPSGHEPDSKIFCKLTPLVLARTTSRNRVFGNDLQVATFTY